MLKVQLIAISSNYYVYISIFLTSVDAKVSDGVVTLIVDPVCTVEESNTEFDWGALVDLLRLSNLPSSCRLLRIRKTFSRVSVLKISNKRFGDSSANSRPSLIKPICESQPILELIVRSFNFLVEVNEFILLF